MAQGKRILIIDDHSLFADGMALILRMHDPRLSVEIANEAGTVLNDTAALSRYDLILIDLHMPRLNGFAFLHAVSMQKLNVRVAVISGTENKGEIERAISLGVCGFIPKDTPSKELQNAVDRMLLGNSYLPEKWLGEIDWLVGKTSEITTESLTSRQLEVLNLMRDGLQNKQIAMVMGISLSAVKGHIENIFKVLNVNNRTACVQAARSVGLLGK